MDLLRNGHPARKKLDVLQMEIEKTKRAMGEVEKAPLALEDARAYVRAAIDRELGSGEWVANALTRFGRVADRHELPTTNTGGISWPMLIAVLGRDQVEERIVKLCAAEQGERGLPAAKRTAKLAELQGALDDLERREEREVLALEAAGHVVLRRSEARADVLFAIWQEMSPPPHTSAQKLREQSQAAKLGAINHGRRPYARPENLE